MQPGWPSSSFGAGGGDDVGGSGCRAGRKSGGEGEGEDVSEGVDEGEGECKGVKGEK